MRIGAGTLRWWLGRLALVAVGILAGCGMLEIALRISRPIPEIANPLYGFHVSDSGLGWRGRPSIKMRFHRPDFDALVETGADGWRSADPAPPAAPTQKILFLGDSFTWGWGVSQGEVFTDELQRRLSPAIGIYNRGVNAFGTAQEYLLMERELGQTHYDHVVLMFFFNDVSNNVDGRRGRRPYFALADDRLLPVNLPAAPLMSPVTRFLKDHVRSFQFIDYEINSLLDRLEGEDEPADTPGPDLDRENLPGAAETAHLLVAMQRLAQDKHARFTVVWIPHRTELEREISVVPYVRAARAIVEDACRRAGIPFIDLAPAFRQRALSGEALIFAHDEHWNAAGHRLAAEQLLASSVFAGPNVSANH